MRRIFRLLCRALYRIGYLVHACGNLFYRRSLFGRSLGKRLCTGGYLLGRSTDAGCRLLNLQYGTVQPSPNVPKRLQEREIGSLIFVLFLKIDPEISFRKGFQLLPEILRNFPNRIHHFLESASNLSDLIFFSIAYFLTKISLRHFCANSRHSAQRRQRPSYTEIDSTHNQKQADKSKEKAQQKNVQNGTHKLSVIQGKHNPPGISHHIRWNIIGSLRYPVLLLF